jgi:hypothetical protein
MSIEIEDSAGNSFKQKTSVNVCDQDKENRETEFVFNIDYSTDYPGYLESTEGGQYTKVHAEKSLNDIAYCFKDMQFDSIGVGECEAFVN